MLVSQEDFEETLIILDRERELAVDTETTSLRPHHDGQLFSIIIGVREIAFYFNFHPYPDTAERYVLPREWIKKMNVLFTDPNKTFCAHNAKFDLAMLAREGVEIKGRVHCTQAIAVIEYNKHLSYSLDACSERLGVRKDAAVEEYITTHHLWDWEEIPGKSVRKKRKHFEQVPIEVIVPYGEKDATLTYHLAQHQKKALQGIADETGNGKILTLLQNEQDLTQTVFRMEQRGIRIDRPFCERALTYETDRTIRAQSKFSELTGLPFKNSGKVFEQAFESEKEKWQKTPKGEWSFQSHVLKTFENPAAGVVLEYRDAKSRADFYGGFLYHADGMDIVHPNLHPDGTGTGRFSSTAPNFQNLTKEDSEEDLAQEFVVRRAVVPREDFVFVSLDLDQAEYRLMLDYAAKEAGRPTALVKLVLSGLDVHEATAQVASQLGTPITRHQAKTTNFLTLYGGGTAKLANALKCSMETASQIRNSIFEAAPEIKFLIKGVMNTATTRKYIHNWAGRRCYFPDPMFAYQAPNYMIQGGCADVVKFAMNRIDGYLADKKSKMVLMVHDELVIEVHKSELDVVPELKRILETTYPHTYVPLTATVSSGEKSWADSLEEIPIWVVEQSMTRESLHLTSLILSGSGV